MDDTPTDDPRTVSVSSQTGKYAATIESVSTSLIMGTGQVGDEQVLVPFVECAIQGRFGPEEEAEQYSVLVTFENAAFLVDQFAAELAELGPVIESMTLGPVKPVPERIDYALECLRSAQANLSLLVGSLTKLAPPSD